tara:strand:+ start:2728 stop:3666 length:939 start_codon:yes stop_codon:yes gene_type:complete
VNLGLLKNKRNDVFNKLKRLRYFKKYLKQNEIQVVLDFRMRRSFFKELLIQQILYPDILPVYMVRSSFLNYYFPKNNLLSKILFKNEKLVVLTEATRKVLKDIYRFDAIHVIPNSIDVNSYAKNYPMPAGIDAKFIVASGRLERGVKQFDKLITAYSQSKLPHLKIDLVILGQGEMLTELQQLVKTLNLENNVKFEGFIESPEAFVSNAMFTVLCSAYEGFPRVILESLACGTPVIATDCPTGPAELIDGTNGILVPYQDFEGLTAAMNSLAENELLRTQLKAASRDSIRKFDNSTVSKDWQQYLEHSYEHS